MSRIDDLGGGGAVAAAGFDLLVLGDDGRIRADYVFDELRPS